MGGKVSLIFGDEVTMENIPPNNGKTRVRVGGRDSLVFGEESPMDQVDDNKPGKTIQEKLLRV